MHQLTFTLERWKNFTQESNKHSHSCHDHIRMHAAALISHGSHRPFFCLLPHQNTESEAAAAARGISASQIRGWSGNNFVISGKRRAQWRRSSEWQLPSHGGWWRRQAHVRHCHRFDLGISPGAAYCDRNPAMLHCKSGSGRILISAADPADPTQPLPLGPWHSHYHHRYDGEERGRAGYESYWIQKSRLGWNKSASIMQVSMDFQDIGNGASKSVVMKL